MAHLSEPKKIDLIIDSPPLSDEERKEISRFIEKLKKRKGKNPDGKPLKENN